MSKIAETIPLQPEALAAAVQDIGEKVIGRLRTVFDPEIPVNIYDLGLIYAVDVKPLENNQFDIRIDMTLTTPNCPVAGQMPDMVRKAVIDLPEANDVEVVLVWDPPWDKSCMSDEAKLHLNMF